MTNDYIIFSEEIEFIYNSNTCVLEIKIYNDIYHIKKEYSLFHLPSDDF